MKRDDKRKQEAREAWLRLIFAWLVLGAWAVSFVLSAILPHYTPPLGIQSLAVVVAGYLFSAPVIKAVRERKPPPPT